MNNGLWDYTTHEMIRHIIKTVGMENLIFSLIDVIWEHRQRGDESYLINLQNDLVQTLSNYQGRNNVK